MARHLAHPKHIAGRHRAPKRRRRFLLNIAALTATGMVAAGAASQLKPADAPPPTAATVAPTPSATTPSEPSEAAQLNLITPSLRPVPRPEPVGRPRQPARLVIPEQAGQSFTVATVVSAATDTATATYRIEVEDGLPIESEEFAVTVARTLDDARSWSAAGHQLHQVTGDADFRVVLASPETADDLCAPLDTGGRLSCRNGENVVINAWRWVNGTAGYERRQQDYRRYVINHEVGHALGYSHVECSAVDALAPVMLQQTKGLDGCRPNPWPAAVDLQD